MAVKLLEGLLAYTFYHKFYLLTSFFIPLHFKNWKAPDILLGLGGHAWVLRFPITHHFIHSRAD